VGAGDGFARAACDAERKEEVGGGADGRAPAASDCEREEARQRLPNRWIGSAQKKKEEGKGEGARAGGEKEKQAELGRSGRKREREKDFLSWFLKHISKWFSNPFN
jgi:hypothetical protein